MDSKKLAYLILSSLILTSSAIPLPQHTQSLAPRSDEANPPAAPEGWYYVHPPVDGSSGAASNPERPPPTIPIPPPPPGPPPAPVPAPPQDSGAGSSPSSSSQRPEPVIHIPPPPASDPPQAKQKQKKKVGKKKAPVSQTTALKALPKGARKLSPATSPPLKGPKVGAKNPKALNKGSKEGARAAPKKGNLKAPSTGGQKSVKGTTKNPTKKAARPSPKAKASRVAKGASVRGAPKEQFGAPKFKPVKKGAPSKRAPAKQRRTK
ncbi:hypothetical protein D9611_014902 [Ephemerocybe angulata]|uniref:Uncharacterized protein n=1 Tax=Ephemerocybe angulata TaxID=980116 RepID=A0A8H5FEZ7_9AGAR|nr:hypothetical protein D9611_014902 [Tulosesus angulatus]